MKHLVKPFLILFILYSGLLSCSNEEQDIRVEKVVMTVQPEDPIAYDFDYSYTDDNGQIKTLSKNYFQVVLNINNTNPDYGVVIVGVLLEATSSSSNGGLKTDKISIGPEGEPSYLGFVPAGTEGFITLNVGGLNPNAVGLAYTVKLEAKGYFTTPTEVTLQSGRFNGEFFFSVAE